MAESKSDTRAVVYQYATGRRCDFDNHAMRQIRLAHELYNELVAIWKRHEEQKAEAWREDPEVDAAAQHVDELREQIQEAAEVWRKSKIKTKDRVGDKDAKTALTSLRAELKEARKVLKTKEGEAYAALLPRFTELMDEQKTAVKATYPEYVDKGLYWATINATRNHWMRAVQAVRRKRKSGQAAELRFRRWQGQGSIFVQLQRAAQAPQRTPELLASGESKWRNVASLPQMQDSKHYSPLRVRSGTTEDGEVQHFTIPEVIWHRPIPPEGDITDISVSRRKTAGTARLWVQHTVKVPKPEASKMPGVCGIDTGWRVLPDGSIRVAVWRSKNSDPIAVPEHLANAIFLDGEGGEVRIPAKYVGKWAQCAAIRSERDRRLELLREQLIKRWPQIKKPEQFKDVTVSDIKAWRSPNRFAYLARVFREANLPFSDALEEWRKQDRRFWEREAHQRQGVINWRTDLFRNVAARLCDQHSLIAVEEPYVAKVTRRQEDATPADDATRVPSVIAAPSSLILALKTAASGRGADISVQPAKNTTLTHSACGHINKSGAGIPDIMITCAGCGETYDQDRQSAWALLELAAAG